jgi:hypothetical protein
MSHDTPLPAFHAGKPVVKTTFGSASTRLLAPQLLFEAVLMQTAGRRGREVRLPAAYPKDRTPDAA